MLTLRLLREGELDGDPARCIELAMPRRGSDTITVTSLRLTPRISSGSGPRQT